MTKMEKPIANEQRKSTNWQAIPLAVLLAVVGFSGTASADQEINWTNGQLQRIAAPLVPDVESTAEISGWLNGAACAGTVKIVERESIGEATLAVARLWNQATSNGPLSPLNQTLPDPSVANAEPLTIAIAMLVLTGVLLLVAVATLAFMIWESMDDPVAKWEYSCSVTGYGIEATGGGGFLRRVDIEAPLGDGSSGAYTPVGAPCEYDGLMVTSCPAPATYRNDVAEFAGGDSGFSEVVWNEENQRLEYDPPLWDTVAACINSGVRAVNSFQVPALNDLAPPAYDGFDDSICQPTDITWVEDTS